MLQKGLASMLRKIDNIINRLEDALSVILFLVMVLVVCWSVLCRYVLKIPFLQGEELARFLMIYIVYIGSSIGVKKWSHIGVEVFVDLLPEKVKKKVKICTECICALMFMVVFVLSIQMLIHLIETNQMTTTTRIPTYYIFICIPVSLLFGTVHYLIRIADLVKKDDGEVTAS